MAARKFWTQYVFEKMIIECRKMSAWELKQAKAQYGTLLYTKKIPSLG